MNILAVINWSANPEILRIGSLSVRWYGLLFSLGFVVGYQIMLWIFNKEGRKQKDLESLAVYMIIGTVVGARLGHCFFYEPDYYFANPLEILKVWKGGLASHGSAFGILLALWLFSRKRKDISMLWVVDRIVIVVALAGFFIRSGNFMNSEIIGKPSTLSWAVVFTRVDAIPRHPAQLYEAICCLLIFLILILSYKKYNQDLPPGMLFGLFLTLIFTSRFIIEFFKERQAAFEYGLPMDMGQMLSIPFVLVGIYFIIRALSGKLKKQ